MGFERPDVGTWYRQRGRDKATSESAHQPPFHPTARHGRSPFTAIQTSVRCLRLGDSSVPVSRKSSALERYSQSLVQWRAPHHTYPAVGRVTLSQRLHGQRSTVIHSMYLLHDIRDSRVTLTLELYMYFFPLGASARAGIVIICAGRLRAGRLRVSTSTFSSRNNYHYIPLLSIIIMSGMPRDDGVLLKLSI